MIVAITDGYMKVCHIGWCYGLGVFCLLFDATVHHYLTHLALDKMDATSQTIFSDAFSWMKSFLLIKILLKFVPKDSIDNNPALV